MQGGVSHEKNVCLSVCPSARQSVRRLNCDKTKETFVHILYENDYPNFPTRRMVGEGNSLYLKFWTKIIPYKQKRRLPHACFRLVPTSVTLNNLEIAFILRYFTEFDSFGGRLRHIG